MPFHAILASENPDAHPFIVTVDELDETHPLMNAPHDDRVARDASTLAGEMSLLLKCAKSILFVDTYYDPFNVKYQKTLRECLKLVHASNPRAVCEIHHYDKPRSPSAESIEREARNKFGNVIPAGMTVTIYRWRQKEHGEDFHARCLLTDKGGIRIDAGFSAEGNHQTTPINLMDVTKVDEMRSTLSRDSNVYELVEPVLQIAPNGYVEHV
jgi:hypothetical protein